MRHYEARTGVWPPALIALAWTSDAAPLTPTLPLPDDGSPHRGLRQFVRLRALRQPYQRFVGEVAQQIVATARAHQLPRDVSIPDLASTPNAFDADLMTGQDLGAPHVHIVVAAGSREQMEKVRENLAFYGHTPEQWAPYLPALPEPLAEHAQSIAADRLLASEVGGMDEVIERIDRARDETSIVVILVDSWSTQLDSYREILSEIDRRGLETAAVLVPANGTDMETAEHSDELRFGLGRTFREASTRPDVLFRAEIETPTGFDTDLVGVIEEARNRLFREGHVHQLPGERPGARPLLTGP
jgi:FxsC-like protein